MLEQAVQYVNACVFKQAERRVHTHTHERGRCVYALNKRTIGCNACNKAVPFPCATETEYFYLLRLPLTAVALS